MRGYLRFEQYVEFLQVGQIQFKDQVQMASVDERIPQAFVIRVALLVELQRASIITVRMSNNRKEDSIPAESSRIFTSIIL